MADQSKNQQYDLTKKLSQYLDRHLIFPLLDFLSAREIWPAGQLTDAKLALLSKTNMIDYYAEIYKNAKGQDIPQEMKDKRLTVVESLRKLQNEIRVFLEYFSGEEGGQRLHMLKSEGNFNLAHLEAKCGISESTLDSMYKYAKFQFECGNYAGAAEYLYYYRTLSVSRDNDTSAMWGKLGAEILMQNWETASEDLKILREHLDNSPGHQLQARTWLIHWALFIFFNHPDGRDGIIDMFFQEKYMNAIQTTCPHILRYLATACITNKKKRGQIKELVRVIEQEYGNYRDPITEFVHALYVDYNFDLAQEKLAACEVVLQNDFFLVPCLEEFVENAKLTIFENYCRIHSVIDIGMVAEKLGMDREKAEVWIVNLIRQARLDARIDSQANQVIMDSQATNVYQLVKEKTKNLSVRTLMLTEALSSKMQSGDQKQRGLAY
jgi:translation initiation factor 3 subunit E|uniref:Eukaryotic translation initiation factor 3 subunit E n=1 Tax=Eutreptiella gymnastica TaxID=73025 RepID=A0A7S4GIM1_9EUGL|eukprot:CAMPEP_0174293726 /NCGR_PEP_ID=MMETSP0809-20121228/39521_1 /TAXON_ID=73025 ORGANISM="Eutreptiella gymnastica-like, Strain CCMP1594" /NCGR_SAMPLE_ID=MMETSP0809 /ASSEMBLY_ACC=CAM_ASM_000658 /LENGTH=436 /DNA_ID=CAMNT_0015394729 /DNA_START=44 /DNA_END=1354 /DNA_ORIENTATION=-